MASRLPLGKQQFKAILTGIVNPLKGIIQPWDDPLSLYNGQAFVCYRTESVKIEKNSRTVASSDDEPNEYSFEPEPILDVNYDDSEEEVEEKKSPKVNNRFVKIYYKFKPDKKLAFPKEYKFAIKPHEFFQLSKEKCSDMSMTYDTFDNTLKFDMLNDDGKNILSSKTESYNKQNFLMHKKRFNDFYTNVFEKAEIVIEDIELYSETIEAMTKKHCIIYYSEEYERIHASTSMAIFDPSRKYQTRLDKNLFPKLSKTDRITLTIGKIPRIVEKNIPECFIMKFDIQSKLYDATVFISSAMCI